MVISKQCIWQRLPLILSASILGLGGLTSCQNLLQQGKADTQATQRSVRVFGELSGELQTQFEASLVPFETETGIDVVYEGTASFNDLIHERMAAETTPDIVIFTQPGLMAEFIEAEHFIPLADYLEEGELRTAYPYSWLELGNVDEVAYALWYRVSVKSLVWYRPTAFEAKGYDIPQTWPELVALSDRIVAEGGSPWCLGLGGGAATGWTGTDWIEDIMLRTAGPEAYSQWIDHRLPFNSPQVLKAINEYGRFLKSPNYVSGGPQKAAKTHYGDAALGLFNEPPDCYLHRQASFVASYFPPDKEPRVDYDVFPLPGIDERFGLPILVSGDAFAMANDTPEARAFMAYLASPVPHEIWAASGNFISPQKQVSPEAYSDSVNQKIAQILADADIIRFDGSDLMPGAVGTDSFWDGMIDFANGESAEDVAKTIDESWPQ